MNANNDIVKFQILVEEGYKNPSIKALEAAIENYKVEFIDTDRSIGTFGSNQTAYGHVSLEHASHMVKELTLDKDNNRVMGEIKLLNTPNGNLIKNILAKNVSPEFDMRCLSDGDKITQIVEISITGVK